MHATTIEDAACAVLEQDWNKKLKALVLRRATVLAKLADRVKLVVKARPSPLKAYRANASKYRMRVTLRSLPAKHRVSTKQVAVGTKPARIIALG